MKSMIAVIMASFLFNMGTFPAVAVPIVSGVLSPEISTNTVDLNELMLSEFVNWDAFMTRYFSVNATTTDIYDYSRVAGGYSTTKTLSGVGFYLSSLAAMYENTGNEYYLAKMRTFIDWMIDDPWFYTDVQGIGEIFSVPAYYFYDADQDTNCIYTMNVGIQSLKLWEWTSEEKYKSLAERIANESLCLVVVNNSTDMAWSSQYYRLRELENARNGVNRQGAIAWFYALYAQKVNSSYAIYIPRIVNWMWRAQLPSGGLAYNIGQTRPDAPYSSYAVFFVLRAYAIQPSAFSSALKEKIARTIQWLGNKAQLSLNYLGTVYGSCALGTAWKTEYFVGNVSIQQVKSFIYVVLSSFHYSALGLAATLTDYPFGWRWSSGSTGLLFSLYPLPDGTFNPDDVTGVSCYEKTTGRYVPTGWMLNYMGNYITDGGDLHGVSFKQSYREVFPLKAEGLAPTSRNITNFGYCLRVKTYYTNNQNISLYAYPTGIYVADVNGTNDMLISLDYKAGLNGWKCTVDNGTTFTLSDLSSGTYQKLGTKYMLWLNSTEATMRRTFFILSPSPTWCYNTIGTDYILLSTAETNYRMISGLSLNWGPATSLSQEYQTLSSMIDFYNVTQPVPFSLVLSNQYETLDSLLTTPGWFSTYKDAVRSDARLIAHNSPETIHITNWNWNSGFNRLMFTVGGSSGTTSITKIYCGDKGEPTAVYATNGTLSWSYNASTKILTLNLLQDSVAEILVEWRVADLNALMFEEFQKWDAMMTRYISINGSLTEYYDYSRAPNYSKPTLASSAVYCWALISFYEATNDEYYLSKLRAMIDAFIDESEPDGFYTFDSYKGEIFYLWGYRYDVPPVMEADFSALYIMSAGISAVWLYQKTGELKYRNLAERIARESLSLAIVSNSTDMAWKPSYCFNGTETDCKVGVNRQCSIAYFYSLYAKHINSTYASYVPKIINWTWRAQLASGGLSYNIGQTSESRAYTAYALWYTLNAYSNVPEQFSETLKTKLNNTINYLFKLAGSQNYNENYILTSALVLAVKSGFISFPTSDYLEKTKTYIYGSLKLARYAEKGFDVALNDYSTGYRWQMLHVGALFSTYPLPANLKTFSSSKISFEEYQTGRYYWQGWAISNPSSIYVGNTYGETGWAPYPYNVLVSHKTGVATRSVTERGYYFKTWTNYTDTKVLAYFYPTTTIFANVTGPSRIYILSGFPTDARLRVENGTIYNLGTMDNGTKVFSNDFLMWRNATSIRSRQTIFMHCPKTKVYNLTRYEEYITLISDISDYNITVSYLSSWAKISSPDVAFSLMQNITDTYHSLKPLMLTTILSHYKDLIDSKSPFASWWNTYKNSVSTDVRIVAHNIPEEVSLTSWDYANQRLAFTILAPSGTTSITKVYCGDKGEPKEVYASNGTLSWSYNASTTILTLNVLHDSPARIVVYWRFPGDIDGDGDVDPNDFYIFAGAYGTREGDPTYNLEADLDGDGNINSDDFYIFARDYGKTETC